MDGWRRWRRGPRFEPRRLHVCTKLDPAVMDDLVKFTHNVAINNSTVMNSLNPTEKLGQHVAPVQGITVHDTDVLEPEPPRKGGLVRPETVRILACILTRVACLNRFSNTPSAHQPNRFRHQPHEDLSSVSTSSLKKRDQLLKLHYLMLETEKGDVQTARSLYSKVCGINTRIE